MQQLPDPKTRGPISRPGQEAGPVDEPDTERTRLPSLGRVVGHRMKRAFFWCLPMLLVAASFVLLFFLDLMSGADMAVFGVRDPATEQRIFTRYGTLIRDEQVRILLVYLGIGALVGVVANLLTELWQRAGAWPSRGQRRAWPLSRRIFMALGMALGFHLWQMAHAIARFPQLFTEVLYDRGGLRRRLMVLLTHQVPSSLVDGLAIGALAGLVLGPVLSADGKRWLGGRWPLARRWLGGTSPWVRRAGVAGICVLALLPLLLRALLPGAGARAVAAPPVGKEQQEGREAAKDAAPAERPSVLLLAVDSLRADRVGPWARPIAPNLAQLAGRSVRFDAAHVTVPRTFPSFVTILTGRYPHHHGIRTMFPSAVERAQVGPALPGALREAGYETAVLSDFCGEIFSRIELGFQTVQVPGYDVKTIVRQRSVTVHPNLLPYVDGAIGRRLFPTLEALEVLSDPDLLATRTIKQLRRLQEDKRPFFLTVFFSSAHFPYAAPAPYYRRFTDPDYDGPFRYHKPPWSETPPTPKDIQQVRGLYNGAVAATDAAIGRVLQALEERGLSKSTIVLVLADHGENLYDEPGRGMGHGDHLEGSHSAQIPLLVYDPVHRFPPHSVPGIVRDIDLAPTLLQLTGAQSELPTDGTSLLPLLRGERSSLGLSSFSETELWFTPQGPGFDPDNRLPYPGITTTIDVDPRDDIFLSERWRDLVTVAKHRALRTDRWKLIYRPTRTGVHWSLYDLLVDPREIHDVAAQHPQELGLLQAQLLRFLADDPRAVVEGGYVIPQ